MDSALEIASRSAGRARMLCPCCGGSITPSDNRCECGARFVGRPLDDEPIKVQRLGPAMTAVLLFVLVASAAAIVTPWLALAVLAVIPPARRAVKLARRDPDWYGGRRVAITTLVLSIIASLVGCSIAITRIPRYLRNRRATQVAATQAAMHHMASLLEDYKRDCGSYPRDGAEIEKVLNESLPPDYWEKPIKYQSYTSAIAEKSPSLIGVAGLSRNNFELKSEGADGIEGTDDDIIMRDGVFLTAAEARKQVVPRSPTFH